MKRIFDLIFSLLGLAAFLPFMIVLAILIKLTSPGPVFFSQERIGRHFRPFRIYKFRSMVVDAPVKGPLITVSGDKRVTRIGQFLRKTKLDEFPQLINILNGDMSFVGPRPEVKKYVELFRPEYEKLLTIRPGITDPASIAFSHEEAVLSASADWEMAYTSKILPEKIRLASQYVDKQSILGDIKIILRTLTKIT